MASLLYGQAIAKAFNKEIDWDTDDIRVALLTSAYTPNQDTHDYWDDVSANEVTGTGYTAGGAALTGKTLTTDAGTNVTTFDAADTTWANSSITARYAVIYNNSPATAATKPVIALMDFTTDQQSVNGNFTVQWNAAGIATVTTS